MAPAGPAGLRLDHVGVVVADAARAVAAYQPLGAAGVVWEDYGPGLLRVACVPAGGTLVEFIEPLTPDGANAEFLRAGGGVHHLAFAVDDLDAALRHLGSDAPVQPGVNGTRIAFVGRLAGVLVELCEHPPGGGPAAAGKERGPLG